VQTITSAGPPAPPGTGRPTRSSVRLLIERAELIMFVYAKTTTTATTIATTPAPNRRPEPEPEPKRAHTHSHCTMLDVAATRSLCLH
jgi:hypothetical protein